MQWVGCFSSMGKAWVKSAVLYKLGVTLYVIGCSKQEKFKIIFSYISSLKIA